MGKEFQEGEVVRFARMPAWVDDMNDESKSVFQYCIGKDYRISEIDDQGQFVLDASKDADAKFGGFMNDIRLEAEYLEKTVEH